jgi:glycosyltransferase involved in cell wall biosynthesis
VKIMSVATAWGSQHGGLNAFNFRLSCALRSFDVDVACYVKRYLEDDLKDATSRGIELIHCKRDPAEKWSADDIGHVKWEELDGIEILIVHDIVTSAFLGAVDAAGVRPMIVAVIHTLYCETDYLSEADDKVREKDGAQKALMLRADLVLTSGSWLASELTKKYPKLASKIRPLVPGRIELAPSGPQRGGSITALGRLSYQNPTKQAAAVVDAYSLLAKNRLVDKAAFDLPKLTLLGADLPRTDINILKADLSRDVGPDAKINFLPYQTNYDFLGSYAYEVLSESSLVATPSVVETFGLASLEAACLGLPLIASRRSGFHDEVVHLVPDHEAAITWLEPSAFATLPERLCDAMAAILKDYERYALMAAALAQSIQEKWPTWTDTAKLLIAEIQAVRAGSLGGTKATRNPNPVKTSAAKVGRHDAMASQLLGLLPDHVIAEEDTPVDQVADRNLAPLSAPLIDLATVIYGTNVTGNPDLKTLLDQRYGSRRCTPLQAKLLEQLASGPPHDYADILLCGGTSSGKTTTAEILFGLANNSDFPMSRILYVAPTRALAQERFRDWSTAFEALNPPRWRNNVILSTGEDHSSDGALSRGEFLIACIVYEKANVILSTSPALLSRLTMVVIDELHMVGDIHRGPILETLLAKLKHEKDRRQRRQDPQPPIRIVGITTEQATAEGFSTYFTNEDPKTDAVIAPVKATHVGRPVEVVHELVEPYSTGSENYRITEIARFPAASPLCLDAADLDAFNRRLPPPPKTQIAVRITPQDRQVQFITDWLAGNRLGRRLLVFLGSKSEQLKIASRVKNQITSSMLGSRVMNTAGIEEIKRQLGGDDVSYAAPVLAGCHGFGIFIHSSDVSRGLRTAIENYLAEPLSDNHGSEIILSTETLSYGVNLAIDDVAIMSLDFPASERNQEYGARAKRLSHCAFGNMCGRAGRLNQANKEPRVFVWAITGFETGARELVRYFYGENPVTTSAVFHADDREASLWIEDEGAKERAPLLYSYPLVRTVLDGLRYVGGAPGTTGAVAGDASFEVVRRHFTRHLLYAQENRDEAGKMDRLRNSVEQIIQGAIGSEFELVKRSGAGYKITDLGSSIIDTGTEISTLAPLKSALEALLTELRNVPANAVPVEALLLPILVQNEAHRQILMQMPDVRIDVVDGENRRAMLEWLKRFSGLGFTDEIVDALGAFLVRCDQEPRHAGTTERESRYVHDACLRLFCGLMLWVSGESIAEIHKNLLEIGRLAGKPGEMVLNISIFAERISWKLLFLSNLMRFSKSQSDLRMLQTKTRHLIVRLRLGCAEQALPFLVRESPDQQPVERKLAHYLLSQGATAKAICAGTFRLDEAAPAEEARVRAQVRNYIRASFSKLKDEFVYRTGAGEVEDFVRDYWEFAESLISAYTKGEKTGTEWPTKLRSASFDTMGVDSLLPAAAPNPSITIVEELGALRIVAKRVEYQGDKPVLVPALQWHVQPVREQSEMAPVPDGYTGVVIDFPWLLQASQTGDAIVRVSPAAFGILLTLIARSFLADPIDALDILAKTRRPISSEILIDLLYPQVIFNQIPEPIFEAWAAYWDAD